MKGYKVFTLQEARQLVPTLRDLLERANVELGEKLEFVSQANDEYESAEKNLDMQTNATDLEALRAARSRFQEAIESLSKSQNGYVSRLNYWVEKITSHGVILRDLREGLLDFPAEEHGFKFLLCWKLEEQDINFWHDENDGIVGRKPLTALQEYY